MPWTLCHGDFHAGNMFLLPSNQSPSTEKREGEEGDNLVLFDWSEVGPWEPTTDLAQTIISDVKPSLFVKHSEELVKFYWTELIRSGVSESEYSWQTCWAAFCRGGPERWIWVFSIIASLPVMPDMGIQYFHDQLLAFIEAFGDRPFYTLKPVVCLA